MHAARYAVALALGCTLVAFGAGRMLGGLPNDAVSEHCALKGRDPWTWLQRPDECGAAAQTAEASGGLSDDIDAQEAERDFSRGQSIVRLAYVSNRPTLLLQINAAARAVRLKLAKGDQAGPPRFPGWSYIKDGTISDGSIGIVEFSGGLLSIGLQDPASDGNRQVWKLDRNSGALTTNLAEPNAMLARCWHMCRLESRPTALI